MNDSQTPLESTPHSSITKERKWITVQTSIPAKLYQEIKQGLNELSMQTGFDLTIPKFAARIVQSHWKVELDRLRKSLETYNRKGGSVHDES